MTTDELEIWRTLNECEVVKKVKGEYKEAGDYYIRRNRLITSTGLGRWEKGELWIPPLYDPIRPERSLIGIYRNVRTEYYKLQHPNSDAKDVWRWVEDDLSNTMFRQDRPDLALAKAIIEQEGK